MKHGRLVSLLSAIALLPSCALLGPGASEPLHVMLQGDSAAELATLVETVGGEVTHDLHIIGAVGARVTRGQLRTALESGLVSFHIDDLATDDAVEDGDDKPCRVRGHIEPGIDNRGISWPLYNKQEDPATWESLEIHWPQRLGEIEGVILDGTPIDRALYTAVAGSGIRVDFPPSARPVIDRQALLRVNFSRAATDQTRARQREFTLEATFAQGCSDKSVPGYDNNHEDYYYNTVAGVDALHRQGITGDGITVAVIDSGLWEHPALARNTRGEPRVLARYDATSGTLQEQVADGSGHGTHMSSIIAHSGPTLSDGQPTGTYKGVAPDANLVAVKVLDREGRAHILDIAQAVQWVVDNRQQYNIRILNISLAQRPRWPYWEDPVTQVVMRAWAAGITVLAAASNEGPEPMSIGSPGNLPYIITVGAVTDSWTPDTRDDDYIPDFSSRGPTPSGHVKPDIVALGGHMTGLTPPDAQMAEQDPENMLSTGELISTGSSQSAALVSGIAALLLQLEPGLTPDDIKCKLTTSAEPAINADGTLAYSPFAQGYGYVTAPRAVTLGRTDCESSAAQLQADLQGVERVFGPAVFHDDDATARLPAVQGQISTLPSAKGMSDTRKWGVKDHIERLDKAAIDRYRKSDLPLNWLQLYLEEKTAIEKLGNPAAP